MDTPRITVSSCLAKRSFFALQQKRVASCGVVAAICLGGFLAPAHADPASVDPEFQAGAAANDDILSFRYYPGEGEVEDRILIGGFLTQYDGTERQRVALLDRDGALVEAFDPGSGPNGRVDSAVLLDDGKVLIGGAFTRVDGVDRNRIARLNADGSLDETFDPGNGADWLVTDIAVDSDGYVLVTGGFQQFDGQQANRIARLQPDGALDETFDSGNGFNDWTETVVVDSQDRILVGGSFSQYSGSTAGRLVRLESNGDRDETFDIGTGFTGTVRVIAFDPDGAIVVGGDFTDYDYEGDTMVRLARLDTDGRFDATFDTGEGFNNTVYSVAFQQNGQIVVGGNFTEVDGLSVRRVARLNGAGTVDTGFDPGSGPNSRVHGVAVQDDGRILLGGRFTEYDGAIHRRIVRLEGGGPAGGYDLWVQDHFNSEEQNDPAVSGPEADPDGDGIVNVLEYAFGGDPKVPYSATQPVAEEVSEGADSFLEISFLRLNANDLVYRVEASDELEDWSEIWVSTDHGFQGSGETTVETVRDTEAIAANSSRFLRVRVSMEEVEPAEPVDPESGFDAWSESYFTSTELEDPEISGRSADPDGDGIINLMEYAFGGDPWQSNSATLPTQERIADGDEVFQEITFYRLDTGDLIYRVQASDDLQSWSEIWVSTDHPFQGSGSSTMETVRDPSPVNGGPRFLRVQVSEN